MESLKMEVSRLTNFITNQLSSTAAADVKSEAVVKKKEKNPVVCSYFMTWTKLYLILIIWAQYIFDVYFAYVRQVRYKF